MLCLNAAGYEVKGKQGEHYNEGVVNQYRFKSLAPNRINGNDNAGRIEGVGCEDLRHTLWRYR